MSEMALIYKTLEAHQHIGAENCLETSILRKSSEIENKDSLHVVRLTQGNLQSSIVIQHEIEVGKVKN